MYHTEWLQYRACLFNMIFLQFGATLISTNLALCGLLTVESDVFVSSLYVINDGRLGLPMTEMKDYNPPVWLCHDATSKMYCGDTPNSISEFGDRYTAGLFIYYNDNYVTKLLAKKSRS